VNIRTRPIALGLLLASGQVAFDRPGNFAIVGELALTGETRPIKGILAMALQAISEGRDGLLVPTVNASEAAVVEGLNVYPVGSLTEAVGFLRIDLHVEVPAVSFTQLAGMPPRPTFLRIPRPGARSPRPSDQAVRRPCPRSHRQRPDDPTPGPHPLQAQARGHEHPQGRHGGIRIIRAGS
jgi:hypothetical protein